MDEQEVMALTGRELDTAVAEQVFGKKVALDGNTPMLIGTQGQVLIPAEYYSATWEGMGLVVEEMMRREWTWLVDTGGGAWCAFEKGDVRHCDWQGYEHKAETLPEAVCRAALLALGKGE